MVDFLKPEAYEASMKLNFHAPVALTYALLPHLKIARGRVISKFLASYDAST
jgi:short-subunit dehydrogenase involved in D-alanine esterification of teichoic acids